VLVLFNLFFFCVSVVLVGTKASPQNNWEYARVWWNHGCTQWWRGYWSYVL